MTRAAAVNISPSHTSQIERGLSSPTITHRHFLIHRRPGAYRLTQGLGLGCFPVCPLPAAHGNPRRCW